MANTRPLSPAAVGSKNVGAIGERRAVDILKDTLGISERLACKVVGLARFHQSAFADRADFSRRSSDLVPLPAGRLPARLCVSAPPLPAYYQLDNHLVTLAPRWRWASVFDSQLRQDY
jgi:hypothetical protein